MSKKVALITGGASGMGLAVATALSQRTHEDWALHLIDLNSTAGLKAASTLKNAHFHQANVTDYPSLVSAFEATYSTSKRLDFVYANAGIVERDNFYEEHDLSRPPPPPNQLSIDINLKSVVDTSYLALHYFRKSMAENKGTDPVLVMTSSCGGLYPSEFCPMYSAAKAGVVHFNRAIAFSYHMAGVRTYALCPGTIRTNLLSSEEWKSFPERFVTPMETLVSAVVRVLDGGDLRDSVGKVVGKERNFGLTVEVNGDKVYFRDQVEYCDDYMRDMMRNTSMEYQLERIEKGKKETDGSGVEHIEVAGQT